MIAHFRQSRLTMHRIQNRATVHSLPVPLTESTVRRSHPIVSWFSFPIISSAVNILCEGHAYLSVCKCIGSLRHLTDSCKF
jgi:hypothetical protein